MVLTLNSVRRMGHWHITTIYCTSDHSSRGTSGGLSNQVAKHPMEEDNLLRALGYMSHDMTKPAK